MQTGVGFRAYLFPRDCFYFTAIDLPHASLDFFCPRSLDACITITFEALDEHAGQLGSFGFSEIDRLTKKFFDIP
jgi:hypothetical protein